MVDWSHRKSIEGCCCYWYWWQLLRSSCCAFCTSNRSGLLLQAHGILRFCCISDAVNPVLHQIFQSNMVYNLQIQRQLNVRGGASCVCKLKNLEVKNKKVKQDKVMNFSCMNNLLRLQNKLMFNAILA